MRLMWVELRDFRNHALTRIDPLPDGLIVAVGPNGEGKTNLLEAMHFLYALGSPRVSTNAPLVRDGATSAYVRGEFATGHGRALVEIEIPQAGPSRVKVDRSPVRRKADLHKRVRAVLFGPFDLPIVIGEPGKRRTFMDEAMTSIWPMRASLVSAYDKALRQRNRLLKEWDRPGEPPGLDVWDEELSAAGAALTTARGEAIERLSPFASEEFKGLAGYDLVTAYAPNVVVADPAELQVGFLTRLAERRQDELQRKTSLVGPHRDELELAVRDLGARAFGSHGETWAAALCLRLGLASAVAAEIGESPLLLIDDPFSALDPSRRDQIGERLAARGGQVLITVADEAHVPAAARTVWDVSHGTVIPRVA